MTKLILSAFFAFFITVGLVWAGDVAPVGKAQTMCDDYLCIQSEQGGPLDKACGKFKTLGKAWKTCFAQFCKKNPKDDNCVSADKQKAAFNYVSSGEPKKKLPLRDLAGIAEPVEEVSDVKNTADGEGDDKVEHLNKAKKSGL